jgi:integrase
MALTELKVKNTKPSDKLQRIYDGDRSGLCIAIPPSGHKRWEMRYKFEGKSSTASLGIYPLVSLKDAREKCFEMRQLLAKGIDPNKRKKELKVLEERKRTSTFQVIAEEYMTQKACSVKTITDTMGRLKNHVFPRIGDMPIEDIRPQHILDLLRLIEKGKPSETAHRTLNIIGQVFRYAMVTEKVLNDPTHALTRVLIPVPEKHLASITTPKEVGELMRLIHGYQGASPIVSCGLKLAPLVFVRPGELRAAEWKDINLEAAEWRYTVPKTNTQHIVPLSRQAVEILKEIYILTGEGRYVFPNPKTSMRPMSENGLGAALKSLGYSGDVMTVHGFRAMARTLIAEEVRVGEKQERVRVELIEHQLAHTVKDPLGRAYNRTTFLEERKVMMQAWADYLDSLREKP